MQTTRALLFIVSATALEVAACGGSSGGGVVSDAGGANTTGDASDGGGGGTGPLPDASSGGDDAADTSAFCAKLASYESVCPPANRCASAEVEYCATWSPSFSAGFHAAVENCLSAPDACTDGGTNGITLATGCGMSYLSTPTPAQQKVESDFCAKCPDGTAPSAPTACTDFFALTLQNGSLTAVGADVLLVNDSLATTMDQQCTGPAAAADSGGEDCAQAFELCAGEVVLYDANLPAACTDVSFGATVGMAR